MPPASPCTVASNDARAPSEWRLPLGGCDCYLRALEDYMLEHGQGRQVGVTMLELGPGFCLGQFKSALNRFVDAYPILFARVHRSWFGGIPEWRPLPSREIRVKVHSAGTVPPETLASELLRGEWEGALSFEVVEKDSGPVLLMGWSHLLFDGRGAELVFVEIQRLATDSSLRGLPLESWGFPKKTDGTLLHKLRAVRPFSRRHSELRKLKVRSLGFPPSRPSAACFRLLRFTKEETRWISQRAEELTGGIFALPYFLALVMRAHAEILRHRGVFSGALECAVSVQLRKRGSTGAIFQNQLSQLFFSLPLSDIGPLRSATAALQEQFTQMNKSGFDKAFLIMSGWMRRLPKFLYKRFISRNASEQITSFYYAHTGAFLPALNEFCGAEVHDGWHIPSVFQPPGTGVFFSERRGHLTCSLSWRKGVVTDEELSQLVSSLREDLLEGFIGAASHRE